MTTRRLPTSGEIDWSRAKDLFADLIDAPAPERAAQLASLRRQDDALGEVVGRLLESHQGATAFLDEASAPRRDHGAPVEADEDQAGDRIGHYELLEVLGEGGFGIVHRAAQHEPVRREVALKILKRGMDTDEVVRRFAVERDVLARMEHPDIATVLDAGATDDGRPFVVMELIRGLPITSYCNQEQPSVRDRVELMARVCRAVHHAHQRAVIHRDLKPSKILVTDVDGRAEPRIIDFGIAKVLTESQRDEHTRGGGVIGTPRYMSPEQIAGDPGADVRVDVYSLGVVLCEMLSGAVPRDPRSMTKGALQESSARRPSRLALRTATGAPSGRGAPTPGALRGDLDRIVLMCVEWDPDRRYDSAAALADDLDRYLRGEPVRAAGPGTLYRCRKFVGRHRLATALSGLAVVSLVVGTTLAVIGRKHALDALLVATEAEAAASRQAARAEFVSRFLLEETLIASDPSRAWAMSEDLTVRQLFREAERLALSRLVDDRQSTFEILARIGAGHLHLRRARDAIATLDKAIAIGRELGPSVAPDLLDVRVTRARALRFRDGSTEAVIRHLADLRQEAVDRLGPEHEVTLEARLACVPHVVDAADALAELDTMLALPGTAADLRYRLLDNRGRVLRALERFNEEIETRRQALEVARDLYGPDHSSRMSAHFRLMQALTSGGHRTEAVTLVEEVLALPEDVVPSSHPGRLSASSHGVRVLLKMGEIERAQRMALDAERTARRASGAATFDHAVATQLLCRARLGAGDDPVASELLVTATALRDDSLRGRGASPDGGAFMTQLCDLLLMMNEPADALDLADRSLDALPSDHPGRRAIAERRKRAHAALGRGDSG